MEEAKNFELNFCYHCMQRLDAGESVCPVCGHDNSQVYTSPDILHAGMILHGKYLVGRMLGRGGFGITYIGFDLVLRVKVAIKEYFPMGVGIREPNSSRVVAATSFSDSNGFEKGRDEFQAEAVTLARFNSESIVHVRDYFLENGTAYIVMDFIDGNSLTKEVEVNGGRISWERVLSLFKPLIPELGKIHEEHLIHRDIKPDNIKIVTNKNKKTEQLVLLDFGAARSFVSAQVTHTYEAMVTPGYAPIEQYSAKSRQGPYSDVYALSATMYAMITGEVPANATDRMMGVSDLKSFSELGISVPENVEKAIFHGLAVRSDDRPQTMKEFYDELYNSVPPSQPTPPPLPPTPPLPPPHPIPWIIILAGVLAACGVIYFVFFRGSISPAKTPTPVAVESSEFTDTPVLSASNTPRPTKTPVPSATSTALPTDTPVPSATSTSMPTKTPVPSATNTALPTNTPVPSATSTALPTKTPVPSATSTSMPTDTPVPSATSTSMPTDTPVLSATSTALPTDTPVPSATSTALPTDTPVPSATSTALPTDTPVPSATNTALPTDTPVPSATNTALPTDTPVPSATSTALPTDTPVPSATNTALPTDTPVPSATNTAIPTATPVPSATKTNVPTNTPMPTATRTPVPTKTPADLTPGNVNADVMLYSSPSAVSSVLKTILKGNQVMLVGEKRTAGGKKWILVQTEDGLEGWIEESAVSTADSSVLLNNLKVGDVFTFGEYEQDNVSADGVEAIEWVVLSKGADRILAVSKFALDAKPYNEYSDDVTWETSALREWLNGEFYDTAFDYFEKEQILKVTLENPDNERYGTKGGERTRDKIFLLSVDEANKYYKTDDDRICEASPFAQAHGAYAGRSNGATFWWLRTPGDDVTSVVSVDNAGSIYLGGDIIDTEGVAVRPAMWLGF